MANINIFTIFNITEIKMLIKKTYKLIVQNSYFGFEIATWVTSQFPYSNAEAQDVR
jgi:hypothetical protein